MDGIIFYCDLTVLTKQKNKKEKDLFVFACPRMLALRTVYRTLPALRGHVGTRYVYKARAGGFVAKPSRTRNLFSTLGRSIGTSKRLFVTYLAGPLWVIK